MAKFSLDQLYRMTAHVYSEQNFHRPVSATFLHFVEVCGMLTAIARKKKRESLSFEDSLCKSLGWFFPLMAKCGVVSVEKLVYRKFPYVCPYCRQCPHEDMDCKTVQGTSLTVDHTALRAKAIENADLLPQGLNEWQEMFRRIYKRDINDRSRSAIGLMEELGELAEAIRVFERHPRFLAGEAADVFSYIMGLANEYAMEMKMSGKVFDFESEYLRRYPGLCLACGNPICTCPSVPPATIGRMAKELKIEEGENLFEFHFSNDGHQIAAEVLSSVGGFGSIVSMLPFDKGQISSSIVFLCYRLSDAIADINPQLAQKLKLYASTVALNQTEAGTHHSNAAPDDVVSILSEAFVLAVKNDKGLDDLTSDTLGFPLLQAASRIRVLMVGVSAIGDDRLNIEKELRAVRQAIERSPKRKLISIDEAIGCTVNELRRKLLAKEYHWIHFFGHGFENGIVLAGEESEAKEVEIDALRDLLNQYPSIKGVLLNSCDSLKGVDQAIGPITIGMDEEIGDEHAISFAVGFYDAICTGATIERAIEEGKNNVKLQHENDVVPIKVLRSIPKPS